MQRLAQSRREQGAADHPLHWLAGAEVNRRREARPSVRRGGGAAWRDYTPLASIRYESTIE
jgi:hypothetical protein